MGRFYSVQVAPSALTAAADIFEFTAATDRPFRLWFFHLYQTTELGDAAEEILEVTVQRAVTAGSGGGSITPVALDRETSADTTCAGIRTTAHTGGTVVARMGWNLRIPLDFWYTPETAPTFDAATDPVTISTAAPGDSTTIGGWAIIEDL